MYKQEPVFRRNLRIAMMNLTIANIENPTGLVVNGQV